MFSLKELFNKNFRIIRKTAIHESAHIAYIYFYGYSCNFCTLSKETLGDAQTSFNYGSEKNSILIILNNHKKSFQSLNDGQKDHLLRIATQLSMIFCAGACAEAYFYKPFFKTRYNPILSGSDLIDFDRVAEFVKDNYKGYEKQFGSQFEYPLTKCMRFFEAHKELRNTIKKISCGLLRNDFSLDQHQIEKILEDKKFYEFIDTLVR